ncbi:MAG: 16S rRNA (guanine(966)-N(2))-methyltransferase RsmD [Oscillospiraceae bacterium]|nr:16S rRNA (guanine(966)-N(2))-methyltransferase RsmD [Oscillospiraceae bacterium]
MRVISGIARGRVLKALEGDETRPTTDKVKESVFNIIQFDIEGSRVLDLFSGSGQLAIEAVSRGAKSAVAVESSRRAAEIIKENIKRCGFEDLITIHRGDFSEVLTKSAKYDVIFLDPPYSSNLMSKALETIYLFDILSNHGIIVCETESSSAVLEAASDVYSYREYKYGRVKLTVIRKTEV